MAVHGTAAQKPGGLCISPVVCADGVRAVMHQKELVEALQFESITQLNREVVKIHLAGEHFDSLGSFLRYPLQRWLF